MPTSIDLFCVSSIIRPNFLFFSAATTIASDWQMRGRMGEEEEDSPRHNTFIDRTPTNSFGITSRNGVERRRRGKRPQHEMGAALEDELSARMFHICLFSSQT
jgi:hypothetical protein